MEQWKRHHFSVQKSTAWNNTSHCQSSPTKFHSTFSSTSPSAIRHSRGFFSPPNPSLCNFNLPLNETSIPQTRQKDGFDPFLSCCLHSFVRLPSSQNESELLRSNLFLVTVKILAWFLWIGFFR